MEQPLFHLARSRDRRQRARRISRRIEISGRESLFRFIFIYLFELEVKCTLWRRK